MSDTTTELEKRPETTEPEEEESGKMSFLEHLDELRKRLLHIVAYLFGGFALCLFFHKEIFNFISVPIAPFLPNNQLVITKVQSGFVLYMKVAFLGGVFITIPGTLYEIWKFIAPGLYKKEKKFVIPFLFTSVILFILGGAFCYYYVLPTTFGWLLGFASAFTPMIDVMFYFDTVIMMLIGFGLIFEMPIIIAFLSMFGLVGWKFLAKNFKYAVLILIIIAAVLSPTGDAINLAIWSGPMILLYIASIGIAFIIERFKKKKEEESA